jgi:uncharacterized Ntn-hydrolase superfamily protein
MRRFVAGAVLVLAGAVATAAERPVATYSIVARDAATGELGVAVQSHWFSVGSIVSWAEAGVGAVATQSFVDPSYGPLALNLLRAGRSAPEALAGLLAADAGRDVRQVAIVDAAGRVAAHTGARCIAAAGHVTGDGFSVQANLMDNPKVWPAMHDAFAKAQGDLADRLLAALDAAQATGGDIRGKQSAALLVVRGIATGRPWIDRRFDLRIEDHPEPLAELRRLLRLARAYEHSNHGDELATLQKWDEAGREYAAAAALAPEIAELPFWHAAALATAGRFDEARPLFASVFAREPRWRELVPRLPAAGLLPDDEELVAKILAIGTESRQSTVDSSQSPHPPR